MSYLASDEQRGYPQELQVTLVNLKPFQEQVNVNYRELLGFLQVLVLIRDLQNEIRTPYIENPIQKYFSVGGANLGGTPYFADLHTIQLIQVNTNSGSFANK